MRIATLLLASLLTLTTATDVATAGGPLGATGTVPRRYTNSTITYRTDQGTLGVFTNATAVSIATYAFQQWDNVATASLAFINGGALPRDVNTATDPYISGSTQFSDGVNPIVFDANGSITDAKLGLGANRSVIGFAGSAYIGNTYVEGYAIINGVLTGSGSTSDIQTYQATITHEIGHFLGLGHSQVTMHGDYCTMYPVIYKVQMRTLQPDDIAAISMLYPSSTFASSVGTITGTVKRPTGQNLSGVNVIAENTSSGASYSTVVDYFSGGKAGFDAPPGATGSFTLSGLPPGSYYVRIEPINASFTGGSGIASYNTPINTTVAREWYNAGAETGDMLTDNANLHTAVTVSAGQTASGINIIANESNTLSTLVYHNGTPYYIWSLPQSNITKYAVRCTAPFKGTLVGFQLRLAPQSNLPLNGSMTITVHQNASGSLAGIPGAVLGSVTVPYSELAADQYNEIYLKGIGNAVNFDSLATFHISVSTNGVGSPVLYSDNGSPSQNRTSYQTSDGVWRNFPDGGWAAGYNLIASALYARGISTPTPPPVLAPVVSLNPTSLNFGQVRTRTTLDKNVRLTNTGNGNLVVTGTSILGRDSIDYLIVSGGGSFTLTPGAYRDMLIRFQPCLAGGVEGPTKSAQLYIASNAATSPNSVPLVGTAVEPAPLAAIAPIRLGRVRPGQTYTIDTALIYNAGLDTVHAELVSMVGVSVESVYTISSQTKSFTIPPDSAYRLQMKFSPVEISDYSGTIRMLHDGQPNYTDIAFIASALAGEASIVNNVDFGVVNVSSRDTNITLYNEGNDTLRIISAKMESYLNGMPGSYFQTSTTLPLTIAPQDSVNLGIRFMPIAGEGGYTGTLTLTTDGYPDSLVIVSLYGSGTALSGVEFTEGINNLSITPNPARSSITVMLKNTNSSALELYDVTGKLLQEVKAAQLQRNASQQVTLDVRSLTPGEYYLKAINGKEAIMRRFIVVR